MHKYRVRENKRLTPTTLLLTLEKCNTKDNFSYQAGQYAAISFNKNGHQSPARCFSLASSPDEQNVLQFSIRQKGKYTNALTSLKPGDPVNVRGPYGSFVIDANRDRDIIMIAGGIGIAPFISIIRQASNYRYYDKLSLIYSVKNQNDIPFLGELVKTQQTNPKLYNTFVVSEGSTDKLESVNTENGRITPEVIHKVVGESYQNKTFFICGPPNFMKAMVDILISKGVSADRIITEAFGQGAVHNAGKMSSWPNKIYALGAVGIAVASLVVMISDLIKNISASQYSTPTNLVDSTTATNSRQDELDDLVNKLPISTNESPVSAAAKAASQPTNATPASPSASTTTTAPAPTPSPVIPTPAPVPKCTTTQSGVTTCV